MKASKVCLVTTYKRNCFSRTPLICVAIGDTTAKAIAEQHIRVECQPKVATAAALADALIATDSLDSAKVLVITGNLNRDELVKKLEDARAIVQPSLVWSLPAIFLYGESLGWWNAAAIGLVVVGVVALALIHSRTASVAAAARRALVVR